MTIVLGQHLVNLIDALLFLVKTSVNLIASSSFFLSLVVLVNLTHVYIILLVTEEVVDVAKSVRGGVPWHLVPCHLRNGGTVGGGRGVL